MRLIKIIHWYSGMLIDINLVDRFLTKLNLTWINKFKILKSVKISHKCDLSLVIVLI